MNEIAACNAALTTLVGWIVSEVIATYPKQVSWMVPMDLAWYGWMKGKAYHSRKMLGWSGNLEDVIRNEVVKRLAARDIHDSIWVI